MPLPVSRTGRSIRQLLLALPVLILIAVGIVHEPPPLFDDTCLTDDNGVVVCAASDMTRTTRDGQSVLTHPRYDLSGNNDQSLSWQVARNETLAFQLIIRREDRHAARDVTVELAKSAVQTSLFAAHYLAVDNAGYQWGPDTNVLPYPAHYPDALVPQQQTCTGAAVELFKQVNLPNPGKNQSLWVDLYIPDSLDSGQYQQDILITTGEGDGSHTTTVSVNLDVIEAQLPHRPTIDAVGETYRAYNMEGAGYDRASEEWKTMSQCYQRLAHQHRMVFIERTPDAPSSDADWANYIDTFGPALSGELFSEQSGYSGTGMDTPVSVWRTPWPQDYDVAVESAQTPQQLDGYSELAAEWSAVAAEQRWQDTRFFAYVFDEVDGPSSLAEEEPQRREYITRVHGDMQLIQAAIDQGTSAGSGNAEPVDLVWTSHSDPTIWVDDPDTTLVDRVRLWAPNAHAANTDFLASRIAQGERAWFYHSGHPAVGGHSINLPGTDMRSWGVIGARYGMQGQLMWAVNLGSDESPFGEPSYKPDDDRVGNGVLVYPGNQLPRIGYAEAPGPVPSMRLKTWRRGLQDAELYQLVRERYPEEADALIRSLIPRALQDAVAYGDTAPAWPTDEAAWIQWRDELLLMLDRP